MFYPLTMCALQIVNYDYDYYDYDYITHYRNCSNPRVNPSKSCFLNASRIGSSDGLRKNPTGNRMITKRVTAKQNSKSTNHGQGTMFVNLEAIFLRFVSRGRSKGSC